MGAPYEQEGAVAELLRRLSLEGAATQQRTAAAAEVAEYVQARGPGALKTGGMLDALRTNIEDGSASAREGGLRAAAALFERVGAPAEPFLVSLLPALLDRFADKEAAVRDAADAFRKAFVEGLAPGAVRSVLPGVLAGMVRKRDWQTKVGALRILGGLTRTAPRQVAACLPTIVPAVSECMCDAKRQVQVSATATMQKACAVVGNRDIELFVPNLISCMARPSEVPDCITKVSGTTFVQAVEAPCLSVLVPLLIRGLRERSTPIIRKTAIIIYNMSQLVFNPTDAHAFLPRLLPGLEHATKEVANPECREQVEKAHEALVAIGGNVEEHEAVPPYARPEALLPKMQTAVAKHGSVVSHALDDMNMAYAVQIVSELILAQDFRSSEWVKAVAPYLRILLAEASAETVVRLLHSECMAEAGGKDEEAVAEDDEGDELCDCEFSLAYGGKILLFNARMRLIRGRRYGLCGANGVGKSTLMRAIAKGQLDGFPPAEELRTVYVESNIDASLSDLDVVSYVFQDPVLKGTSAPERSEVERVLRSVGFEGDLMAKPIASMSGGWRMKVAIARAMLMRADILLLDEPTNHLDVANVRWLEQYLVGLSQVTSMIVSHDSGFLDTVCTDIIHYESQKLVRYKGNLAEFVRVRPEAKAYYALEAARVKFTFPRPGMLQGVTSRDRAIVKMRGVAFAYPGSASRQLVDVNLQASLSSRVAVLGANGAGKSTLIKLLTGETEACEGAVWRHPNLRLAYVAQHAFHHVEKHLDQTALAYLQWRWGSGEDKEGLEKVTRKITEEEAQQMERFVEIDGKSRQVEELRGRRKLKNSFEYEVKWRNIHEKHNSWIPREKLMELGFTKLVNEVDVEEATRAGLISVDAKPFTTPVLQQHLIDFGLDIEFSTHSNIRGLSGGQKVKVVLAAAMWNNPHLLVLDEPTNFLDRDSLGALAQAIREFQGGVVMISHNTEFTSALCNETWLVADQQVSISKAAGAAGTPPLTNGAMRQSVSAVSLATTTTMSHCSSSASLAEDSAEANGKTDQELTEQLEAKAAAKALRRELARQKKEKSDLKKTERFARKF